VRKKKEKIPIYCRKCGSEAFHTRNLGFPFGMCPRCQEMVMLSTDGSKAKPRCDICDMIVSSFKKENIISQDVVLNTNSYTEDTRKNLKDHLTSLSGTSVPEIMVESAWEKFLSLARKSPFYACDDCKSKHGW